MTKPAIMDYFRYHFTPLSETDLQIIPKDTSASKPYPAQPIPYLFFCGEHFIFLTREKAFFAIGLDDSESLFDNILVFGEQHPLTAVKGEKMQVFSG